MCRSVDVDALFDVLSSHPYSPCEFPGCSRAAHPHCGAFGEPSSLSHCSRPSHSRVHWECAVCGTGFDGESSWGFDGDSARFCPRHVMGRILRCDDFDA